MIRSVAAVMILAGVLGGALGFVVPVSDASGAIQSDDASGAIRSDDAATIIQSGDGPVESAARSGMEVDIEQSTAVDQPRILALYPNPTTDGDRGEFVTVSLPPDANLTNYALGDEHATVSLSPRATNSTNVTDSTLDSDEPSARTVTFSTDPGLTSWLTDRTVAPLSDELRLANEAETVQLLHDGTVVDEVQYEQATEGNVYNATAEAWEPLGTTDRPVVTAEGGSVETFVLPDEPDRAVEFLDSADDRVLLAGYTISSPRVVETLVAAVERGVEVEVLVDGSPVGGMTGNMATALSELDRAGATVHVLAGDRTRYRYHHAKYAVVDSRALVTTENWKPAGTGGRASRGWAVITDQTPIVEGLVETYRADTGWVDTIPWPEYDPALVEDNRSTGDYPQVFEAQRVPVERTQLLVTPDNADREILDLIETAEKSIVVKQVRIGDRSFGFLQAVLDAAARGVEVRVLLSGAWYVEEENRQLAAWLTDQATAADLPLSVRLADPDGAFEKIHAKGMVVDGEYALVGSINWNENSVRNNREVAVLLEGGEAATYFEAVFEADWQGRRGSEEGRRDLPLGVGLAVLAGVVVAVLGAKRIRFG